MPKLKNKEEKTDFENLKYIKECFEQQIALKGFSNEVVSEFVCEQEDEGDDGHFECSAELDGYTLCVEFQSFITSINIEMRFTYPNSDIKFCLDDVLNVLNINDFEDYFFDADIEDEKSQEKAVEDILSLVEKYDYDIKKAGDEAYFSRMCEMHNDDEAHYNNKKIKVRSLIKITVLERKMRKTKSEKDINAYIKYVEKQESTVGIDHKTRRFVEYLKAGYTVPDCYENSVDSDDKYSKAAMVCYIICAVIGLLVAFGIFLTDHAVISQKGIVNTGGVEYISAAVSGLSLGYIISRIFGTKIILALTPQEHREKVLKDRKNRYNDTDFFDRIFSRYCAPVVATIIALGGILMSCNTVCITDNSVINHDLIGDREYKFEDVKTYLSTGYWDDEEYMEYDYPCYVFKADDELSLETGEIKNEKRRKEIEDILKNNGVKVGILDEYSQEPNE